MIHLSYEVILMNETTQVITATEFKTHLGKYLDYVIDGHEVIITKNGTKSVQLTPYATDMERTSMIRESSNNYQYKGKKVSYEAFIEIYDKSDSRMEYINGEIVLLPSPSTFHQDISGNLYVLLRHHLKDIQEINYKVFYGPFDVHFFKKEVAIPDVMQPDLLVACDVEQSLNDRGHYLGTPTLCIEVLSKITRSKDLVDKLNTYMLSGVKEYWAVDPNKQSILVYGFKNYEIDEYRTYKAGDILESYSFNGLTLVLTDVFS